MKQEQHRVGARLPKGMNEFMSEYADAKGISKNSLFKLWFWDWKKHLDRRELILMFGEENLTEMEIALYAERKRDNP